MYAEGSSLLEVNGTVVSGCSTPENGGGVSLHERAHLKLLYVTLSNNSADATETESLGNGGAIRLNDQTQAVIYNSLFKGNKASADGGAIHASGKAKMQINMGKSSSSKGTCMR